MREAVAIRFGCLFILGEDGLKKVLKPHEIIASGVAATVGAGIFVTSGVAVHQSGPALLFAYIASAFAAMMSAICYSEMGARYPGIFCVFGLL